MSELFLELDRILLSKNGRIIHQVWFGTIPNKVKAKIQYKKLEKYRESWINKNPTWYRVEWDKNMSKSLIKTFYPEYLSMYQNFPYDIQRCDTVRYCFLHRYGGLYSDMDYYCNKPFDEALDTYTNNFYLVETPNMPYEYVSNSLMYSSPKHLFWISLLLEIYKHQHSPIYYSKHLIIMYTAGPGTVNRVYNQYKEKYKLSSFPSKYFQPFGTSDDILSLKVPNVYTVHVSKGCWHSNDSSIIVIFMRSWRIILFILIVLGGINYLHYLLRIKKVKNHE